jgi:hypothetical protein
MPISTDDQSLNTDMDGSDLPRKKVCEKEIHDEGQRPSERIVEAIPNTDEIPKSRPISRPRCFKLFEIGLFREFLKLRANVDILLEQSSSILISEPGKFEIYSSHSNLLKNRHMLAYFFHKLWQYVDSSEARIEILKKLDPTFNFDGARLVAFKRWGLVLDHDSKDQWLGGIDSKVLGYSTILNWRGVLNRCLHKNDMLKKISIGGHLYLIPN